VVERYRYDAYGACTVLDADWSADADGLSDAGNLYRFTGRRLDVESGMMQYRRRSYSTSLGRFTSRDPGGFVDGFNVYSYCGAGPINHVDPNGECACHWENRTNCYYSGEWERVGTYWTEWKIESSSGIVGWLLHDAYYETIARVGTFTGTKLVCDWRGERQVYESREQYRREKERVTCFFREVKVCDGHIVAVRGLTRTDGWHYRSVKIGRDWRDRLEKKRLTVTRFFPFPGPPIPANALCYQLGPFAESGIGVTSTPRGLK